MKAGLAAPWRASGDYRHDARRSHSPTVAVFIMSDFRCIGLKGAFLSAIHGKTLALAFALYFHAMATGPVHAAAPIISAHPLLSIAFAPTTDSEPTLFQSAALLGTIVNVMPNAASFATSSSIVDAVAVVAAQRAVPPSGELATVWIGRIAGLIALAALFVARLQPLGLPEAWWPFFFAHGLLDTAGLLILLFGSSQSPDEITAVAAASAFGAVTVVLTWRLLDERMSPFRLLGIRTTFCCVGALAYSS